MTIRVPVARRRSILAGLGAGWGAAASLPLLVRTARANPSNACLLQAEQEIGPYYLDRTLLRSDVVEGRPGLPLALRLTVLDARSCTPVRGAAIDLWQCDALGLYSGYTATADRPGPMPPPGGDRGPPPFGDREPPPFGDRGPPPFGDKGPPAPEPTDALTFLRGVQFTDAEGQVRFQTIVPGCYPGRTNHVHFRVRTGPFSGGQVSGGHLSHVGQVFFPEEIMASLMQRAPYGEHRIRRTVAAEDFVFTGQHGAASTARIVTWDGKAMEAELAVAIDPDATPQPVRMGPPPRPSRP